MSQAQIAETKEYAKELIYITAEERGLSKPNVTWLPPDLAKRLYDALIVINTAKGKSERRLQFTEDELEDPEGRPSIERKVKDFF